MSDIRLKTITIEPNNPLTIQHNYIHITHTQASTDALNGTIVSKGGISVNCSSNGVSNTSGGALTVAGGMGITKDSFLGGNLTMEQNYTTFKINGITKPRVFIDTSNNKNIYFSPDGQTTRFDLTNTDLTINLTKPSTNMTTGALVINGGIAINCTNDSGNFSSGGALNVAGGVTILGDTFINNDLHIQETTNLYNDILLYNNSNTLIGNVHIENNDLHVINSTGNIYIDSKINDTIISSDKTLFHSKVNVTTTDISQNSSTGSVVLNGGLSIDNTNDATSTTSGGAMTIAGGLSVKKKTILDNTVAIEMSNGNKNNKFVMYQNDENFTEQHKFSGLGIISSGSMRLQIFDTNKDFVFYSCTNGSAVSNEVFRIKGTNEVQFIGDNQRYSIIKGGSHTEALSIQGQSDDQNVSFDLFSKKGDSGDDVSFKIFGKGLPNNITDNEHMELGWNAGTNEFQLQINNSGSGTERDFVLSNQFTSVFFSHNGTTIFNSTKSSLNATTGSVIYDGGVAINNTSLSTSLSAGGALTVDGGASFKKEVYMGEKLHIIGSSGSDILITNTTSDNIVISSLHNTTNLINTNTLNNELEISFYNLGNKDTINNEKLQIYYTNGSYQINSQKMGNGVLNPIYMGTGNLNNQICLSTNGNVGINTTDPSVQLHVIGNTIISNNITSNTLTISTNANALGLGSGGALTVNGGASILRNTYINGVIYASHTSPSLNRTSGAIVITGGVSIQSTANSSNGVGGGLSVYGGAYIAKDLYLSGNLNVLGQINGSGSSSTTYAYLTLTATDGSVNYTTGSMISYGGITIQSDFNANSLEDGGSFLTLGGASIAQDTYIGGSLYNYGFSNLFSSIYYSETGGSFITVNDNFNTRRFSFDRDDASNNLSISRYDSSGVFMEKSIDISNANGTIVFNNTSVSTNINEGAIITNGGVTINATADSNTLSNGGSFTTFGGMSINKKLRVAGNVILSSTTESVDTSSGAVMVHGGLAVIKNMNIGGNTVIQGNLTVNGVTSSIQSTNVNVSDNILVLNAGPAGSKDSGFLIQRYQPSNDTGLGDVIADAPTFIDVLPSQSGVPSNQIKLSINASSLDDAYINYWIKITSGFSINQTRKIISYVGATRIATLDSSWTSQNPAINDNVSIYNKSYVGLVFNEINNRFEFGASVSDQNITNVSVTDHLPIYFSKATVVSTDTSTSSSIGAIVLTSGGLSINATQDASSNTSGGCITVAGGLSVAKRAYIGTELVLKNKSFIPNNNDVLTSTSFTAANNMSSPTNITGLAFSNDTWSFDIYLSVQLIANTNMYGNYHIRGINKGNTWEVASAYVGDSIITISITSLGQLQYTTPNYSGFVSLVFKYKVVTN